MSIPKAVQACTHFIDQKDGNGTIAITFCNHEDNENAYEGNCTKELCPLGAASPYTEQNPYATAISLRVVTFEKATKNALTIPKTQQAALDLHINRKVSQVLNELSEEVAHLAWGLVRLNAQDKE